MAMLDYERLTVRDLKRIVNREEATPAAIGLFVLYDYWEREHGRRAIVDNKLLRYIESKWQFSPYANELDFWLEFAGKLKILEVQALEEILGALESQLQALAVLLKLTLSSYARVLKPLYEQAVGRKLLETAVGAENVPSGEEIDEEINLMPSEEELERVTLEYESFLAGSNGYISAMIEAEKLLGIALTESIAGKLDEISTGVWTKSQVFESFDKLEGLPDNARLLRSLFNPGHGRLGHTVSKATRHTMSHVIETIGLYLTPKWINWARAGVNLRELAGSSKGVVDLLQHAEQAAEELAHE